MRVLGAFGLGRGMLASCALVALSLLTACAGRPTGVLLPIAAGAPVAGTSRVDMLVATTRKSATDRGVLF